MNVAVAPPSSAAAIGRRIRVMVVDDAVVVRGLFSRWVEAEAGPRSGRLAAHRARGGRPGRARRPRRGGARRRDAGARRHRRAAAAAGKEARPRRDHGLHADAPQRRDQLARAVARRRRLYPEAGQQPRGHHLGGLPPRTDREDPPARPARQAAAPGGRRAAAVPANARRREPQRQTDRPREPCAGLCCGRCR